MIVRDTADAKRQGLSGQDLGEVMAFESFLRANGRPGEKAIDPAFRDYAAGAVAGVGLDYRDIYGFEGDDS